MKLFADFVHRDHDTFSHIELSYSCLYWINGNPSWFCRIWRKNWVNRSYLLENAFGESYGKNKFEAYRNALKNLKI